MATKKSKQCYQGRGILDNPTGNINNLYIDESGYFRTQAESNKKKFKKVEHVIVVEPEPTLCELLGLPAWLCERL